MISRSALAPLVASAIFFTFSISVAAQHVVNTVPVGTEPVGVAINPLTDTAYVANDLGLSISVIRRGSVIATIPTDASMFKVAVNPIKKLVYATGCTSDESRSIVVVIDGRTNQIVTTIPLSEFCLVGTPGIAVNPLTNRIYVGDNFNNQVAVIDGSSNEIVSRIDLAGRAPVGVAVDLRSNKIWVGLDGPDAKLDVIDGVTNTVTNTITVAESAFLNEIAINPFTHRVYITSGSFPANLYVLDTQTEQVLTAVPIGGFVSGVDVDPLTNLIFIADGQGARVVRVDGRNNTITGTVQLTQFVFPYGVAVNPVTRQVYVTEFDAGQVEIITEN